MRSGHSRNVYTTRHPIAGGILLGDEAQAEGWVIKSAILFRDFCRIFRLKGISLFNIKFYAFYI